MNNPKLNEHVHNVGGDMYVCRIIDDSTVEVHHFWARWLKVICKVTRDKTPYNQLWAV